MTVVDAWTWRGWRDADIGGFGAGEDAGMGVLDVGFGDFSVVTGEGVGAAFSGTTAVLSKVEHEGIFAGLERGYYPVRPGTASWSRGDLMMAAVGYAPPELRAPTIQALSPAQPFRHEPAGEDDHPDG